MDTFKTGKTTDGTCSTCLSSVRAFKVALKSFSKSELVGWGKVGCKTFATAYTAPEVCLGLLFNYIDVVHQIAELVVYEEISESDICSLVFGPRCGNMTASTHVWEVVVPSPLVKTPRTSQVRISDPT